MLSRLHTLKSKSFEEQLLAIERLTDSSLHLHDRIRSLLEEQSEDSVFRVYVSSEPRKVVLVALLAIIAADIAAIPDEPDHQAYRERLEKICRHLSVEFQDLVDMQPYVTSFENLLESQEIPAPKKES